MKILSPSLRQPIAGSASLVIVCFFCLILHLSSFILLPAQEFVSDDDENTTWLFVENRFTLSYLYYRVLTSSSGSHADWKAKIEAFRLDPTDTMKRNALPKFREMIDAVENDTIKVFGAEKVAGRFVTVSPRLTSPGGIPTSSLPSQGEVIDQLGAFLIERVQEEATLALLDQIRSWLADTSRSNVLPKLLPNSTKLVLNTQYTTFQTLGTMWQSAFRQDLNILLPTLTRDSLLRRELIADGLRLAGDDASSAKVDALMADINSALPYVRMTSDVVWEISKGRNALEVMSDIPLATLGLPENALRPLQLVQTLAREIHLQESAGISTSSSAYTLTVHRLATAPPLQRQLFVELLAADLLPNDFVPARIDSVADYYLPRLREALTILESLRNFVVDLNDIRTVEEKGILFQSYIEVVSDLLATIRLFPTGEGGRIDSLIVMGEYVVDLRKALASGSYGEAVTDLMLLYQTLTHKPLPDKVYRLVAVAANVASAQSGDEIISAFRAAASPVGSYRTKRERGRTFAINAYVGVTGGAEFLFGDTAVAFEPGAHFGLWAPIGVEYAWGFGTSSISIFLSLVDLGAVLNYRIHNPEDSTLDIDPFPQVGFAQVFSPGLHLIWGTWEKAPVTFGLSAEMTPRLRAINRENGASTFGAHSLRIGATAAIDLTLMLF